MSFSQIAHRYIRRPAFERLCQGDILKDVTIYEEAVESADGLEVQAIEVSYVVIVSQDCDLEQDHNNRANASADKQDKFIDCLLGLKAFPAELLREGKHLESDDATDNRICERQNSKAWSLIKSNQHARYHYLPAMQEFQLPSLLLISNTL